MALKNGQKLKTRRPFKSDHRDPPCVSTPAQRHTQQLQHLRAALRAAGLHGTRAGMWPLQQRPSRQVAVGSETEALSSRQRAVAGSPQAAHRQVRAAVSTLDCSQQAPRRPRARARSRPISARRSCRCARGGCRCSVVLLTLDACRVVVFLALWF